MPNIPLGLNEQKGFRIISVPGGMGLQPRGGSRSESRGCALT
jgi:hypothetical protein